MRVVSGRIILLVSIVAVSIFGSIMFLQGMDAELSATNVDDGISRAAIIDQLYNDIPSKYFENKTTSILEEAGYQTDYYTTDDITIDFYKNLPSKNYDYIVIRSHGSYEKSGEGNPLLHTGEKYTNKKYIQEQLLSQIQRGATEQISSVEINADFSGFSNSIEELDNSESFNATLDWELVDSYDDYFIIGTKFVNEVMKGQFPSSTIILGGCYTTSNPSLAEAFLDRGASSVIGWDDLIDSNLNDKAMIKILQGTLLDDMELPDVVDNVLEEYSSFHMKNSTLEIYT